MTALADLKAGWDQAAREDAMGNIITIPDITPDEFWQRGWDEVNAMLRHTTVVAGVYGKGRALDFGCGIGRLTSSLAPHFDQVEGVDISREMVARAKDLNIWPKRVRYTVNRKTLKFPDGHFDLVYSSIVLQHMPQELQRHYVREFMRVIKRDGVAVFQIAEHGAYNHMCPWLSMYGTDRAVVERWVVESGGRVVDVDEAHAVRYTAVTT